jgi:hypothetical protein
MTTKPKQRKAWRVEKTGNSIDAIYRREKYHKPSGNTYEVFAVSDYTTGARRLQSFSDSKKAVSEAQRISDLLASGNTTAANFRNSDAASYGRATEILRDAGLDTPLELVAAHHVEAVKILGSDKIVVAALDFVRRNPTERPARSVRQVADELIELKAKRLASKPTKDKRYIED